MNQQEREVIAGIFDRLKQVESAPRDPEAERFIAERVAQQPYAPYAMAQAIHVQEQALANLHQRVQELEAEVTQAKAQAQQGGGFLSGLFGGGRPPEPPRQPMASPSPALPPSAIPPSAMPQPGMPQPGEAPAGGPWAQAAAGRGGFLAGAMQTAAGVAGGMLLGNALASAFGVGSHGKAEAAPQPAADKTPAADTTPAADEARYDTAAYEDDTPDDDDDGDFGDDGGDDWV